MKRVICILALMVAVLASGRMFAANSNNQKGETAHPVKHFKFTFE